MNVIKDMVDNKGLWYFITFPVISVIIIYIIVNSNLLEMDPMLCILISFGIILFNIIICVGFVDIIKSKNLQIENEKLKSQKLHNLLLEEKIDNTKQFIHDFKKHINILNGFVNCQDYDKLKEYLEELTTEFKNDEAFVITGNRLIDLSLNANKKILMEHSIDVKYDVKIKNSYPVSDLDFNIVFSNILDNAIESCINTKGHFIKIKLDKKNDLIILKIINPCFHVNENYETMKKNDEYHGYGIKNIKKIVQKYNGVATFDFNKENNVFVSTVIFFISND
ncbi:MAG: GHKL domain-containing protein [Erysipelotrichaceae bacterium]